MNTRKAGVMIAFKGSSTQPGTCKIGVLDCNIQVFKKRNLGNGRSTTLPFLSTRALILQMTHSPVFNGKIKHSLFKRVKGDQGFPNAVLLGVQI